MNYFCTYFDFSYSPYWLALYKPPKEHCPEFRLWVLRMDSDSYEVLSHIALTELHLNRLDDLERGDHALLMFKQSRSRIEYYLHVHLQRYCTH